MDRPVLIKEPLGTEDRSDHVVDPTPTQEQKVCSAYKVCCILSMQISTTHSCAWRLSKLETVLLNSLCETCNSSHPQLMACINIADALLWTFQHCVWRQRGLQGFLYKAHYASHGTISFLSKALAGYTVLKKSAAWKFKTRRSMLLRLLQCLSTAQGLRC